MKYDLSVIIPVYDEEKTIRQLLEKLVQSPALAKYKVQFIVVDDGSSDKTSILLRTGPWALDQRFVWMRHEKNQGKGTAIRTGLKEANGEYTIIQDADLEYDPNDIVVLLEHARQNNLPTIFGSRNLNPKNLTGTFLFYWGGRSLSWLANLLFGQKLTDEATCYKLIRTDILKAFPLTCKRFEFCPEVTALLSQRGIKIQELPISYFPRSKKEGKKINFSDGLEAYWTLLRLRLEVKSSWLFAAIIFIFVGLVYAVTWNHLFMGYEAETARSAVDMFSGTYQVFRAGAGAVVMYLPFVAIAKIFYPQDVMGFLTLVPLFYSALCAVVLYFIACYLTPRKSVALIFALLTAIASLMWPYSRIGMEYQAMLWLAVLLLALLAWRKNSTAPILVGVALAMLVFSKSYGIIFALPALIFLSLELKLKGHLRKLFSPSFLTALFGPTILVLAVGVSLNYIIFGKTSGAYNLAQEFQVWSWWEGFFGVFFSAGKSLLLYSPLLIFTLWYWKRFWQKDKSAAAFVISSFLLLLLLTAPFSFWSDETLSVRKLMPVVPLLHLPLIFAFSGEEWNKFKKIAFAFVLCVALYFQFINSLYPYWLQLVILRPYNLDTLSTIRYNPRLSGLVINHKLLKSYLSEHTNHHAQNFVYQERSWMRCCTGEPIHDPFLTKVNISLASFDRPEIYLVKGENKKQKTALLALEAAGLIVVGGVLMANFVNYRRKEKI